MEFSVINSKSNRFPTGEIILEADYASGEFGNFLPSWYLLNVYLIDKFRSIRRGFRRNCGTLVGVRLKLASSGSGNTHSSGISIVMRSSERSDCVSDNESTRSCSGK